VIDSHAHIGLCEGTPEEVVSAARLAGVRRILDVGLDERTSAEAIAGAERFEEVFACVGRHPNNTTGWDDAAARRIEELAGHPRVRAIGETGLDYYRDHAPREDQRRSFEAHAAIAQRLGLPLVIHMREATEDSFEVLRSHAEGVTVVLHCFSADSEAAEEAAARGWYCSFAGNLTYPKSDELREAARVVPDELLLCETDCPFLAPQSVRGQRNQPAFTVETAELLAELRGVDYATLEATVEANAARVFKW
jgi:TatD DNase family protein